MTVIVATRKGMWSDSRCTYGDTHFPTEKILRRGQELIGLAGDDPGIERFLEWYAGDRKTPLPPVKKAAFEILVLSKKGLFLYGNSTYRNPIRREFAAIGTGGGVAIGALAMGADARRAVEIACEHADGCGLPVQEFIL